MSPEQLNELRLFYLASSAITPIIEEQQADAYTKLIIKFREGNTNLLPFVAECAALTNILEEIQTKLDLYESISKEQN